MQNQEPDPKPEPVEEPREEGLDETACCASSLCVLTFNQFQDEVALRWDASGYKYDKQDLDATATNQLWHTQNLLPFVEGGGELPMAVCKSIVKHGWNSLDWFARHYPKCLGENVYAKSGRAIPSKDLRCGNTSSHNSQDQSSRSD
jgi:hypothetical protein